MSPDLKYEIAKYDLDKIVRMSANIPSNIPKEVALIPTVKEEKDIIKML